MDTAAGKRRDRSAVSLTGLFTGQVWVRHNLSPKAFHTTGGEWMLRFIRPLDSLSNRVQGISLETMLLQRHLLIDRLVAEFVVAHPDAQVVEIACGLSNRAARMLQKFASARFSYLEADLPDVVDQKRDLYEAHGFNDGRHRLTACNILRAEGELSLENLFDSLDRQRPVLVINEGLVNYFPLEVMQRYWTRLAAILTAFPVGVYLADIWPRLPEYQGLEVRRLFIKGIELLTRQPVPLHFENDQQMIQAFHGFGFHSVQALDPDIQLNDPAVPPMRKPTLFRVLRAETRRD